MDDFLFKLYREGKITGEVALVKAHFPNDMREKLMSPEAQGEGTIKDSPDELGIEIS